MIEIQVLPNSTVLKGPGGIGFFWESGGIYQVEVVTHRGTMAQQIGTAEEAEAIIRGQVQ